MKTTQDKKLDDLRRNINRLRCAWRWTSTVDDEELCAGNNYVVQDGHRVVLPLDPADGDVVYLAPANGDWQTLSGEFVVAAPTTLLNGQELSDPDAQVLGALYNARLDNWTIIEAGTFSYINNNTITADEQWQAEQW